MMTVYHVLQGDHLVGHGTVQTALLSSVFVPSGCRLVVGPPPTPDTPRPTEDAHWNVVTRAWDVPPRSAEELMAALRFQRNRRLAETDWVVLRAADRGEPVPSEWLAYRQALRDITDQADPLAIVWPVAPAA